MFKKNIGSKDRLIRAIFSFLLFVAAYFTHSWLLLGAAVFTAYEALASWCVVYALIGKTSCKR
jgi:hypothetical protein